MNKSLSSLALIAVLGVTLSACGSSNDVTPAAEATQSDAPVTAPTADPISKPAPAPTEDSKKSVRGNLVGNIGDIGTISDGVSKKEIVKFTVDSIAPGTCNQQFSSPPENGHIVLVKVTAETTPDLAEAISPHFSLSGHDFKFIAANGTTFNGSLSTVATYSCIPDAEQFPSAGMGPAEKVSGTVVLDVPEPSGVLVMKAGYGSQGFEYNF